jgi:hypothetical protein
MSDDSIRVEVRLDAGADADAQELYAVTAQLRQRLLDLDVDSVDRLQAGEAPPGTRAVDPLSIGGGLIVTLAKSPELLKNVLGSIGSWLVARRGGTAELQVGGDTIKLTGVSSEDQRRLIDLFVARHTG